ncbi:altronate dehydratase [Vibrio maritimus]|uniref:Altronate dehydratase n=1 Tax=Vibrio maritimus TaxID=990268 RepID=A0A090S1F6_9VIBR|nr:altronate dehydratase [Vibrio maritimus]
MKAFIKIHSKDNVIVCLQQHTANQAINVDGDEFILKQDMERGSKVALKSLKVGDAIYKYGNIIGTATQTINCGEWVHTHNMKTTLSNANDYHYTPNFASPRHFEQVMPSFKGYNRANGEVAIRNEIWVIPTVGCVNGIAQQAIERFKQNHPTLIAMVCFCSLTITAALS